MAEWADRYILSSWSLTFGIQGVAVLTLPCRAYSRRRWCGCWCWDRRTAMWLMCWCCDSTMRLKLIKLATVTVYARLINVRSMCSSLKLAEINFDLTEWMLRYSCYITQQATQVATRDRTFQKLENRLIFQIAVSYFLEVPSVVHCNADLGRVPR